MPKKRKSAPPPPTRFEAILKSGKRTLSPTAVNDLSVDRLPDVSGAIRVIITSEEAQALLDQGYEISLKSALDSKPLDQGLVMSDAQANEWLAERLRGIAREKGGS